MAMDPIALRIKLPFESEIEFVERYGPHVAKGGIFKGPFKINGDIRLVPQSGVLTAFDGMQILAKTTGKEDALDIEFSPPAGSAFPVDLIFYPLDDRETVN